MQSRASYYKEKYHRKTSGSYDINLYIWHLMKRGILLSVLFIVLLQSCSTDFDLTSDWKDVTVVYGILDKGNDTTFIKISKAFLDPKTDAYTIAKVPDSLYYKDLTVQLQETGSSFGQTVTLEKVDGNAIGHRKKDGIFSSDVNTLYITTIPLNPDRVYKLTITNKDDGKTVMSSTHVIGSMSISSPSVGQKISLLPGRNLLTRWKSAKNGKVYGIALTFNYKEYDVNTNQLLRDTSLTWNVVNELVAGRVSGGDDMSFNISGTDFYNFLKFSIPANQQVYRVAGEITFTFTVGGEEYYTYTQVAKAHNGLTAGQAVPEYTNIENGIGLFTSRIIHSQNKITLQNITIDTLACGIMTRNLNFLNASGVICP